MILPEEGEKITMAADGTLIVPDQPLIAYSCSDESSVVWSAAQRVLDAAVAKAYHGERAIVWMDESVSRLEETALMQDYPLAMRLDQKTSTISSVIFSGAMLLLTLGWREASDQLMKGVTGATRIKAIPVDSELLLETEKLDVTRFAEAVIAQMDDVVTNGEDAAAADQYDELADKFHEEFEAGAEKTAEFAHKAMEKARQQLTVAGKFTEEQGQKLKTFLENDFARVSQEMRAGAKEKLNPARLGAGALASMSKLLHKTGVVLSGFADKADDALSCKSGEITSAGKLKCNACGYEMNFRKTGRIPPCPKCHKTEFTKGY